MKYLLVLINVLLLSNVAIAQKTTKYYNDISSLLSPQVPQENAKFSRTTIVNEDGTKTFEEFDIAKNILISSKTYKLREPYGIWAWMDKGRKVTCNYDFKLNYIKKNSQICKDTFLMETIKNPFADNDKIKYIAPVLASGLEFMPAIFKKIVYPPSASKYGISGKVYVQFEINQESVIQNVMIRKGKEVTLDKEVVRAINQLKFVSPPMFEGKPIDLCMTLPIHFKR